MSVNTDADQNLDISIRQKISISENDFEVTNFIDINSSLVSLEIINDILNNATLDFSSIITNVLSKYNPANLGNTDICGILVVSNNVDTTQVNTGNLVIDNEILFGDGSSLDIIERIQAIEQNITDISSNLSLLDLSSVKYYEFNDLSGRHNILQNKIDDLSFISKCFDVSNNTIIVKLAMDISNILTINNNLNYLDIISLDNSINNILTLSQLNDLLSSYNFTNIDSNTSASDIYVNDVSQTFYEIITQQPYKFDSSGIANNITTSSITINWDYNKIIARDIDNSLNIATLSFMQDIKLSQLPYINEIQIDISGYIESNTGWIPLDTISIPSNTTYNSNLYKEYVINKFTDTPSNNVENILSKENIFDIRIYGINFANNYPTIEDRSILFTNLSFNLANPPSRPIFISESTSNLGNINKIIIEYKVDFTENLIINSNAVLNHIETSYNQYDTLRSSIYPINNINLIDQESLNNINRNTNFTTTLISLYSGTKYLYTSRVKNNLNKNTYSQYSNVNISEYIDIPNSLSTINTSININITGNKRFVTTPNFINQNIIYINIANSDSLTYANTGLQYIEITNPNTNKNSNFGYGKYIDNLENLVTLSVSVDNLLKQKIIYDGSFISQTARVSYTNNNTFDYIGLVSPTLEDMYSNNEYRKGFRLVGNFNLNNISNSDITLCIGDPSSNPYELKFNYQRDTLVNAINQDYIYNIYIDNFNKSPSIVSNIQSIALTVLYNMGIPSIKEFKLNFNSLEFSNINSINMYLPGDQIIATVESINTTSASINKNLILYISDINTSGSYLYDNSKIQNLTASYYNSLFHTSSKINLNNTISIPIRVYNLYNSTGVIDNYITTLNHYVDYNSFNLSNLKINTSKLNLNEIHIYEILNISLIGSDLNGLNLKHYNDHTVEILNNTLLFINGYFQSNSSLNYPNISEFNYNDIAISNNYNSGEISYDLNGSLSQNNDGYKWIVFKLYKNSSNINNSYIFNNLVYNLITNDDNVKYLSLKSILQNYFKLNDIDNLFDNNNTNAVGFCKVTLSSNNYSRIGNFKQSFNPTGGNWIINGSPTNVSYNATLALSYGCRVENINGDYGIYLEPTSLNDDLTIYIGIKN